MKHNQASSVENPLIKSLYQNEEKISELKSELSENYCFLHLSTEVKDLKAINDWIFEKSWTPRSPSSFKNVVASSGDVKTEKLEEIYEGVLNLPEDDATKYKLNHIKEILLDEINYRKQIDFKTQLEYYENLERGTFNQLKDSPDDVLKTDIKRMKVNQYVLTNFNIYELIKEGILNNLHKREFRKTIDFKS